MTLGGALAHAGWLGPARLGRVGRRPGAVPVLVAPSGRRHARAAVSGRLRAGPAPALSVAGAVHAAVNVALLRRPPADPPPVRRPVTVVAPGPRRGGAGRLTAWPRLLDQRGVPRPARRRRRRRLDRRHGGRWSAPSPTPRVAAGAAPAARPGWLGKPHACARGGRGRGRRRRSWCSSTPTCGSSPTPSPAAVAVLDGAGLDLVSPWPRPARRRRRPSGWCSRCCSGCGRRRCRCGWPSARRARRWPPPTGSSWCVRRAAYDRAGGHAAVRGEVLEDVALLRAVKRAGGRGVAGRRLAAGRLPDVRRLGRRCATGTPSRCGRRSAARPAASARRRGGAHRGLGAARRWPRCAGRGPGWSATPRGWPAGRSSPRAPAAGSWPDALAHPVSVLAARRPDGALGDRAPARQPALARAAPCPRPAGGRRHGDDGRGDRPRPAPTACTSTRPRWSRRLLPRAELRRRAPAHRLGLQPLGRRACSTWRRTPSTPWPASTRRSCSSPRWAARTRCATSRQTGEFTVNLTPEALFEQVNATGTDFPPEHERGRARRRPARAERAWSACPGSADSPVSLECVLHGTVSPRRQHGGLRPGRAHQPSWAERRPRRPAAHRAPAAAGPARRQRVVDHRRGQGDPRASPTRTWEATPASASASAAADRPRRGPRRLRVMGDGLSRRGGAGRPRRRRRRRTPRRTARGSAPAAGVLLRADDLDRGGRHGRAELGGPLQAETPLPGGDEAGAQRVAAAGGLDRLGLRDRDHLRSARRRPARPARPWRPGWSPRCRRGPAPRRRSSRSSAAAARARTRW